MKITRIETHAVRIPVIPEKKIVSSLGEHRESRYVIVRLFTDDGLEGVGEATVMPIWSGETVWGSQIVIDRILGPAIIGCDPRQIDEINYRLDRACAHNWFCKAALEMACWDVHGKAAGKPVYELLGGAVRPLTFACRYSMGNYEPDRARRRATELVAEGFQTIKVKVGGPAEKDIERVRVIREAIGSDRRIVIDANCGWDADTAIYAVNAMEPYNIDLVEQPTPDGDYAAIARVRKSVRPPVMADDMCFDMVHARELIRNDGCDVISLYPGKNAGISRSKAISEYAAAHGVACSIGSNLELDIATAAMGHLVIACSNIKVERYPGDVLGPVYHVARIAKNPLVIEGPNVSISDRPGLGIDVDWDVVKAYPCD